MRAGHQSTVGCCLRRDPQAVGFTARTRAEPVLLAKRFMALGKMREFRARAFAIMLVVMAGSVTCGPASPILGRSLLRRLGWLGLGWSLVGRLGRPLSLGSLLSPIAPPRFSVSVLRRAPQSSSASRRLLEGAAAA